MYSIENSAPAPPHPPSLGLAPFLHLEQAPGLCAQCTPGRLPSGAPAPVYAHTARTDALDLPPCNTSNLVFSLRAGSVCHCSELFCVCRNSIVLYVASAHGVSASQALSWHSWPSQPPFVPTPAPVHDPRCPLPPSPPTVNGASRVTKPDTRCVCKACKGGKAGC